MQQVQQPGLGAIDVKHAQAMSGVSDAQDHAQFLYIINHDLKAGLRALAELPVWIDEDLQGHDVTLPADVQEHLDMMRRSAKGMMGILDGLVDLHEAGRTTDEAQRTTVQQVARRAWERVHRGENIKLETSEALDTIYLPRNAVAAVFKAVLENALHHHDRETGLVTVASETDGERVFVSVEDDGPGVPKEARSRVFDSLVMLRRREETGRAGLGLTVAQKLVTKLGGTISLTDASNGRGTAVLFDLPVRTRW